MSPIGSAHGTDVGAEVPLAATREGASVPSLRPRHVGPDSILARRTTLSNGRVSLKQITADNGLRGG